MFAPVTGAAEKEFIDSLDDATASEEWPWHDLSRIGLADD